MNNKTEYKANELITIVIDPSNCLIDTGSLELIMDLEITASTPADLTERAIAPHNIGDMFIA